jgi:DNA-binding NarL/FixJ family response regulator
MAEFCSDGKIAAAAVTLRWMPELHPEGVPIRVVLCDDVAMLRGLLREELEHESDVEVIGEARDGVEVVEVAERLQPEVVVLNLVMPRRDGLEAIPLLRALDRPPEVLVFSGYRREQMAERTRALGAVAYVEKGGKPGEIREVVRTLADGLRRSS